MLTRVLQQRKLNLLKTAQRSVHFHADKGYHVPIGEGIEDVIHHLDKHRPKYTLLYFAANWNPTCAAIEKDYEALCRFHADFHHIRVDCDATPKVQRYFDARYQPSFLALVHGGEIARYNHFNFEKLSDSLHRITHLQSQGELQLTPTTGHHWERFYDEFDKWARYGEYDRDTMRL